LLPVLIKNKLVRWESTAAHWNVVAHLMHSSSIMYIGNPWTPKLNF